MFGDKTILITGETGSFGNAVLRRFVDSDVKEIRIFSRDEKKQDDMRHQSRSPKVKLYIGDLEVARMKNLLKRLKTVREDLGLGEGCC